MRRFLNSIKYVENCYPFWKYYYGQKGSKSKVTEEMEVSLRSGQTLTLSPELIATFDEVFLREVYRGVLKPDQHPSKPVIVDIGANVGYASAYFFYKFPEAEVYAFEPVPRNLALLDHHKAVNPHCNLVIDRRAIHPDKKKITLNFDADKAYTTGASMVKRNHANGEVQVPAVSLTEAFSEYGIETCDLLKIDCEGAEYEILFGCSSEDLLKVKNIAVEAHNWVPDSPSVEALVSLLESHDFKVVSAGGGVLWCTRS